MRPRAAAGRAEAAQKQPDHHAEEHPLEADPAAQHPADPEEEGLARAHPLDPSPPPDQHQDSREAILVEHQEEVQSEGGPLEAPSEAGQRGDPQVGLLSAEGLSAGHPLEVHPLVVHLEDRPEDRPEDRQALSLVGEGGVREGIRNQKRFSATYVLRREAALGAAGLAVARSSLRTHARLRYERRQFFWHVQGANPFPRGTQKTFLDKYPHPLGLQYPRAPWRWAHHSPPSNSFFQKGNKATIRPSSRTSGAMDSAAVLHICSAPSHRLESVVNLVVKSLERHEYVRLCALERAMIVALDAARIVCAWSTEQDTGIENVSSVASMVHLHTSSQRDVPNCASSRSKVSITLQRSVAFRRHTESRRAKGT